MIIRSLDIIDFSGTRDRHVDLAPGFNVIEGENESGKTTLASFIRFIFYGLPDKAHRERYTSWGSTVAAGALTLSDGKGEYRVERECSGPGRDKIRITDLATGAPCFGDADPADIFLGVPVDVFDHSAYVGQISGGEVDGGKVSRAIQNILFSADENVSAEKALKKIDDARILLYYKNLKGGKIHELKTRRDDLLLRAERARKANADTAALEASVRDTRDKLEEARAKADETGAVLRGAEFAVRQRGLARLKEFADSADKAAAEYDGACAADTFDGFIPDAAYVSELEDAQREYRAADEAYEAARAELEAHGGESGKLAPIKEFAARIDAMGGREEIESAVARAAKSRGRSRALAVVFFILTALFGSGAAALFFVKLPDAFSFLPDKPVPTMITGGAAALSLMLAVIFIIRRSQARVFINEVLVDLDLDGTDELEARLAQLNTDATRLQIFDSRMQEYERRASETKMKRDLGAVRLEKLLAKWGRDDAGQASVDAAASVEKRDALKVELDKFVLARDTLADQLGVTDVAAALAEYDPDFDGEPLDPERMDRVRHEYDFYFKQSGALGDKLHNLETELAVISATRESPGEIADELARVTADIERLTKKHAALVMAYDGIVAAETDLRESVSPRLAATAGEVIATITGGKYDRLGVGHELELAYDAQSRSHGIEFMSAGTRDVAYLSLRFALIELLFDGKTPPLIFDESFSRLDDKRYGALLCVIGQMTSRGVQTLLFTSQHRDADLACASDAACNLIDL